MNFSISLPGEIQPCKAAAVYLKVRFREIDLRR